MEEKKYFTIKKTDGTEEKMELLATVKDQETNRNYLFYKNCNDSNIHYYAAAYDENDENEFANLDTNLSDEEKSKLNELFEKLMGGDVKNVGV